MVSPDDIPVSLVAVDQKTDLDQVQDSVQAETTVVLTLRTLTKDQEVMQQGWTMMKD